MYVPNNMHILNGMCPNKPVYNLVHNAGVQIKVPSVQTGTQYQNINQSTQCLNWRTTAFSKCVRNWYRQRYHTTPHCLKRVSELQRPSHSERLVSKPVYNMMSVLSIESVANSSSPCIIHVSFWHIHARINITSSYNTNPVF